MRGYLCLFILFFPLVLSAQVDHWESLVYATDQWKYHTGASGSPGPGWNQPGFNDVSWSQGQGGFGYGDNDDNTVVSATLSVYLRIQFSISNLSQIESLLLQADFDDAFIAYINGTKVAQSGFAGIQGEPSFDTPADQLREAVMYQGGQPDNHEVDPALLVNGSNLLAIQIHNQSLGSSDLSSIFYLHAGLNVPGSFYRPVPVWFTEPLNYNESTLPLVIVDTNGQTIPNDPRIVAYMGIIDNGPGNTNHIDDIPNIYNGRIEIETRGSSSQSFPKKSYRLETQDNLGANNNVSLLGMPADNDWILYGPYSDKSLMRNALTFYLGEQMGRYAPRFRYVELYLNGEYHGIYMLMENIKQGPGRVDISDLRAEDISGDELTGGYIVKVDRPDPEGGSWLSEFANGGSVHRYQIVYPRPVEIQPQQYSYIQNFIREMELLVWQKRTEDPFNGFPSVADELSFVDFFIMNELGKNVDAYRLSSFLYKEKITKGGKIFAGPLWDFNLAFGNADYCEGWSTSGWAYVGNCDGGVPFYWKELLKSERYLTFLKARWKELREGPLAYSAIETYVRGLETTLKEPAERNFSRWNILGKYVWPNAYVGTTYADEVNYLLQWTRNRLTALDNQINLLEPVIDDSYLLYYPLQVYPNPVQENLTIKFALLYRQPVRFVVYSADGAVIKSEDIGYLNKGIHEISLKSLGDSGRMLPSGLYYLRLTMGTRVSYHTLLKE